MPDRFSKAEWCRLHRNAENALEGIREADDVDVNVLKESWFTLVVRVEFPADMKLQTMHGLADNLLRNGFEEAERNSLSARGEPLVYEFRWDYENYDV